MYKELSESFESYFGGLKDQRIERHKLYSLTEILIENALHWTLDVVFNEDSSRVRKDHAGENMAIVRHIVVNMLSNAKKLFKNIGLKALRKKAGWGNETLGQILKQNF